MEKQKAYAFTTPNLECCSPSSKRRKNRRIRRRYEGDGGRWGSCGDYRSWGDPVRSTDLEVSRHLHPCTNLGMQNALAHNSGRSAPGWCPFWAFNAPLLPFLALNARTMLVLGVQRQNYALFWRLNARQMLLQGVIFLLLFLIPFSIFIFILWLHMIMNLIKHERTRKIKLDK